MNTEATAAAPIAPTPRRVRTETIVGGVLVLVICAIVAQQTFAPGTLEPGTWLTWVVLGLGVLLLAAGVAAVVKQTRNRA